MKKVETHFFSKKGSNTQSFIALYKVWNDDT